jgi:hypothetical protein
VECSLNKNFNERTSELVSQLPISARPIINLGFAVAELLGLSLGMKEIVSIAFPIAHEKTMHQMLLQEYMLEMAPISILYKEDV